MAIYELGREDQKIRLAKQAQVQSGLQAFADFLQKKQLAEPQMALQNAQANYYNQQSGLLNAKQLAYQNMVNGVNPMAQGGFMQTYKDPLGNTYKTQAAIDYEMQRDARRSQNILDRGKELAKNSQKLRGSENQPMSADAAGRYAFAKQALNNAPKIKSLLFKANPDGTETFDRGLAAKIMVGKFPNDTDAQNLKRMILQNATAQGLIQSGTVVKDNEWERLMQIMGIDLISSPEAAKASIDSQISFMQDFVQAIRPSAKTTNDASDIFSQLGIQ